MSEAQERQEASFDPTGHPSPGQQLRLERERQGLSLEEVAVQLNLRPAVVTGLEEDRYDEVPVAAYRRGYLRAYARLMGIDEREVVDAYNAQHGRSDLERKVTPVHVTKPPSRVGAWIFKLVTVLVIFGLIGLTLLWWQSRNGNDLLEGLGLSESVDVESLSGESVGDDPVQPAPTDDTAAERADDGDAALPPLPEESDELGLVEGDDAAPASPQDETTAGDDEASMLRPDTAPVAPEDDTAATTESPTGNDTAASTAEEGTGIADDETTAEAASDEAEPEATPAAPAVDDRRLELTFNEQSWTEIFDANGERIFVGLQSAGTQATTEGEPPFRLTIGNASGVELRYRGESVDLESHTGGNNVARFTLGE